MKPKIIMTFDAQGGVQTIVEGAKGRSCTDLTAFLDREFAGDRIRTADYYRTTLATQVQAETGIS